MKRISFLAVVIPGVLAGLLAFGGRGFAEESIYGFKMRDIDGKEVALSSYAGKALVIVNTASKCGFTGQYASLEKLYQRYRDKGLRILAFPANNFREQEPGTNAEIKQFCDLRFKITFDLFSKIDVTGSGADPLYVYLTGSTDFKGPVTWNFNKFVINPEGKVIARFDSPVDPLSPEFVHTIEAALPKA